MEVLKSNFEEKLPLIREALIDADFIAIDTEFTGTNRFYRQFFFIDLLNFLLDYVQVLQHQTFNFNTVMKSQHDTANSRAVSMNLQLFNMVYVPSRKTSKLATI